VETLKQEGMAGLQLHLGFHMNATCLPMSSAVADDDFVPLHGFPEQRLELYTSRKKQIQHPPELLIWYPELEQERAVQCIDPEVQITFDSKTVSYSTPVQDLIGCIPAQCIVEMSKILDQPDDMEDDWRRLWSELLNRPVKEVVSQKEEGPTRFLLTLWCRSNPPSEATIGHLIKALNAIYRNDVARMMEKYCKELSTNSVCEELADASNSASCSQGVGDAMTADSNSQLAKAQIDAVSLDLVDGKLNKQVFLVYYFLHDIVLDYWESVVQHN
jgi:hypothetical protein